MFARVVIVVLTKWWGWAVGGYWCQNILIPSWKHLNELLKHYKICLPVVDGTVFWAETDHRAVPKCYPAVWFANPAFGNLHYGAILWEKWTNVTYGTGCVTCPHMAWNKITIQKNTKLQTTIFFWIQWNAFVSTLSTVPPVRLGVITEYNLLQITNH